MALSSDENPFLKIRTRWMPLWVFCGLLVSLVLLSLVHSTRPDDETLRLKLFGISFYLVLAVWMYGAAKRSGLSITVLVQRSGNFGSLRLGALVLALLAFALGAWLWTATGLAHVWPSYLLLLIKPKKVSPSQIIRAVNATLDWTSALVLAPVLEEVLFRGILLNRWAEKWGLGKAIIFSSMAFGILHANALGSFAFGTCMSLLYIRTGSLRHSMAAHALNNLLTLAVGICYRDATHFPGPDRVQSYRHFPFVSVPLLLLTAPVVLAFARPNWPAKGDSSPYVTDWLRATELASTESPAG